MEESCRICLLGDGGVGKSSLCVYFRARMFVEETDPTIDDTFIVLKEYDGQRTIIEVLDAAGSDYFEPFRPHWVTQSDAIIIVYCITERDTFAKVSQILEQVVEVKGIELNHIPVVIAGNKIDLEVGRQVSTSEGFKLSRKYQVPFFETTAKFGCNVDAIFCEVVREFRTKSAENKFFNQK